MDEHNPFRSARLKRNSLTALTLGFACSGAIFGNLGLAITAGGTFAFLALIKLRKNR